jgi:hypothetical protein
MNLSKLLRRTRKSFFVLLPLVLLAGYCVHDAASHYTGAAVQGTAELGGCDVGGTFTSPCHGGSSSSTIIHLLTPAEILAGHTYTIRVSVSNPSNPLDVAAGFDLDVNAPAMLDTVPGMHTQLTHSFFFDDDAITHTQPQAFSGDSAVWSLKYTARPTPGIDTIYIAANAVVAGDSANPDAGDRWDSITAYITVLPFSGVAPATSQNAIQVYPNPASDVLFIDDAKPADVGSYTLTDPAGRVVRYGHELTLDGKHSVDISGTAAGAYILSVQTRSGQTFTRRVAVER